MSALSESDAGKIRSWNQRWRRPKIFRLLHDLVEESTLSRPDAIAVHAWDGELTYEHLENSANRLAVHLRNLNVREQSHVGICMAKSKFAVIAMLAVLRAGAAWVPLGISDPGRRIQDIVADTQAPIVLADNEQAQRLENTLSQILVVDDLLLQGLPPASSYSSPKIPVDSAAYIIYTSGSTGKPKGVILEHSGISTVVTAQAEELPSGPSMRRLQFAAFTFDVSVADIFTTLCSGGCVCIPSEADRLENLEQFIRSSRANFASITSTVAGLIEPTKAPSMKLLLLGGESCPRTVLRKWLKHAKIRIGYGPTECTVSSSHGQPIENEQQGLELGFPLTGCWWVVHPDDSNRLCAIGEEGELLIESPTVGRGYLGDSEKTENAFVTDPAFVADLGLSLNRRMYRSGDIVRQNPDGSVAFVARRDKQMKIRGQRVEAGEIEHKILELHPALRAASVLLLKRGEDGVQASLVAALEYFDATAMSAHGEKSVPIDLTDSLKQSLLKLRQNLTEVLPPYMVPSIYLPMNRFPLNLSGKVDQRALEAVLSSMDLETLSRYSISSGPSGDAGSLGPEAVLKRLWSLTLSLDDCEIALEDDFFRLGGDGKLAQELVAHATAEGLRLTVAKVFQYSRLSDMALAASDTKPVLSTLDQYRAFSIMADSNSLQVSSNGFTSALHAAKSRTVDALPATAFQELAVAGNLAPTRSAFAYYYLDGDGPCDVEALRTSISRLVNVVECLRTIFVRVEKKLSQLVLESYAPSVQSYNADHSLDRTAADLMAQDMFKVPQLNAPMFDVAVIRETASLKHRIMIRISRSLLDDISLRTILKSLEYIHSGGQAISCPPFSRYIVDVHRQLCSDEARDFWSDNLHDAFMPQIGSVLSPKHPSGFESGLSEPRHVLLEGTSLAGLSDSAMVKSAWALVLSQYSGQSDVLFGDVMSTRELVHADLSDTLGCCSALVPLRVRIPPSCTAMDLIQHVQDLEDDMIPYSMALSHEEILRQFLPSPRSTSLTSAVDHRQQNLDSLILGNNRYEISCVTNGHQISCSDVTISAISRHGMIELNLSRNINAISPVLAQELLDKLCSALRLINEEPNDSVSILKQRIASEQHSNSSSKLNGSGGGPIRSISQNGHARAALAVKTDHPAMNGTNTNGINTNGINTNGINTNGTNTNGTSFNGASFSTMEMKQQPVTGTL